MSEPAAPPQTGPRARGQESVDRVAMGVAGLACGVYLLQSLPSILFPTGLLASVLTLLAGVLLGLACAGGALALAFYRLTHPRPGAAAAPTAAQLQPRGRSRRRGAAAAHAAALPGPVPPHAIALHGEFSGVVYTAPVSAWRREDTPGNWPPTCDPSLPFRAWEATVSQGTLVLRTLVPPPGARPPSPRRGAGSGGAQQDKPPAGGGAVAEAPPGGDQAAAAAEPAPAPAKVGIPLEGCTVELVVEGLKGRSEWIRRAPLLVAHPQWNLLEGEPAFFLWADDPASKQQWLHALGWWCQDAERLAAIDGMYAAYCQSMRDRSLLEYAEHAPQLEGGEEPGVDAAAAGGGGQPAGSRRGWKGWGSRVQTMRRRMQRGRGDAPGGDGEPAAAAAGSVPPSPERRGSLAPRASPAKPPLLAAAAATAEINSLESIIEARWMQSRKIQVPPAVSEAVVRSRQGSLAGSVVSSPKAVPRSASNSAGVEAPGAAARGANGGSSATGSLAGEGCATPPLGSSPAVGGAGLAALAAAGGSRRADSSPAASAAQLSSAAAAAALPPGSPLQPAGLPPQPHVSAQPAQQEAAEGHQEAAAAPPGAEAGAPAGGLPLPEGLPPLLSPDYAVNAFVARLGFDLLRRPDFTEHLRARIQRQLGRMQRPEYIQSLEVVGVDAGGAAPSLRNLRALPQPEAAIWPQVMFDMRYQGAFTVTIELKVDFREAGAWGRLDQALTRLAEGKPRGGGGGGPPHAASAPSMGAAAASALEEAMYGEEGGEEEAAPGSPESSAASSSAGGGGRAGGRKPRGMLGGIRQSAANKLRQLAESTAVSISRIPLRLSLTFTALEGRMVAWIPPPPGNRLFYSFVAPPHLELSARPELAGRLLKYSYHIARVSNWVEQRMRGALTKTMVFPGGGDLLLPMLLPLDHANTADGLPSLGRYVQAAAAAAAAEAAREADKKAEMERMAVSAREQEEEEAGAGGAAGERHDAAAKPEAAAPAEGEQQAAAQGQRAAAGQEVAAPGQQAAAAEEQQAGGRAAATVMRVVDARPPAAGAASMLPADPPLQQAEPQQAAAQQQQQADVASQQQAQQAAVAERSRTSSGSQELQLEPTLSKLPSMERAASGAASGAAAGPRPSAAAGGGGDGHLISPRYGSSASEAAPGSPEFDIWAAAGGGGGGHAGDERGRTSAADAWDAALAQERRVGSTAPTPRFASQQWQQPPPRALSLDGGGPSAAAPPPARPLAAGLSLPPAGRPALQLRLSATRSLDPDFTSSAEHTRFGESPAAALPDYSGGVRRTLSARSDGSAGGLSARGGRDAVGAAISRSLDKLRRQGSSLQQGSAQEAAAHAEHLVATAAAPPRQLQPHQAHPQRPASPPQEQRPSSPPQQQGEISLREQYSPRSAPHEAGGQAGGGSQPAAGGDPRGLRQQGGSFKAQAKGFLSKARGQLQDAGKALASQVHEMQQQRAAVRQASRGSAPGGGAERSAGSGGSPGGMTRSPSQQAAL